MLFPALCGLVRRRSAAAARPPAIARSGERRADRLRHPRRRPRLRRLSVHRRRRADADLRRDEDPQRRARRRSTRSAPMARRRRSASISTRGWAPPAASSCSSCSAMAIGAGGRPRARARHAAPRLWQRRSRGRARHLCRVPDPRGRHRADLGRESYPAYQPMVAAGNIELGDLVLSNYDIVLVAARRRWSRVRPVGRSTARAMASC